ncbi:hypothetical protein CR513_29664, partial [Mucuna pruriens]
MCVHKRNILKEGAEVGGVLSAFVQREVTAGAKPALPRKCSDPGIFSVPCTIGSYTFTNAMLDLGASINVMPASTYKSLNFGDLELTDGRQHVQKMIYHNSWTTIPDDGKNKD